MGFGGLTFDKIFVILLIALFVVGPDKLPGYAKRLGEMVRSIKRMADGAKDRLRDEMGLAPCQTIAMGDGANDLKMLAVAGLGVGMHPKPVVRQHADVSLRYVGLDGLPRLFAPAVS